ncbi:MAG: hypothetical protein UU77_C0007G0029 [candidate division WWE3 bacterium GW2011_GWC1_41_7]|uniref:Uncharacterized protein n=3 Tax=Katanobacteria TaxID=422282 RepID=A0A0G0X821_UNCKA|nr:MAG: hypothetical protein UU77_C0007G0029 [candidate division WWE3 bacterium GW2011_GWC1_41_7]KKS21836.1 MAG: hypothetical protein UU80_C0019G0016 [candidate division WWE3 bacterium GW2011_GWA1_41_8]OGC58222.1 MAG: hypothetical protein A2976_03910 [candidate division WWE3 bacterium RIFCSPLOWO2_01_FULL_41_9]
MTIDFLKLVELIKDPDLRMKITDLYGQNIQLKEENHKLRSELQEIKEKAKIDSELVHKHNHYYKGEDGTFCTRCWDADNKLIGLHEGSPGYGQRYFSCPNCNTNTYIGEYIQPNVRGVDWQ